MRKYTPIELPKIERIDGGPNGRRYKVPNGNLYPSVTTIFSVNEDPYLAEWKARVGEEEARKIATRAAKRGTYLHEQCEHLLKGTVAPKNAINTMLYGDLWKKFKPIVDQIGDVKAIETTLYSDELEVAGTVDCIGYWNGRLSVIDFKTSSRKKAAEDIPTYWMQCAAYAKMWEERTGEVIEDLTILMSVEDDDPLKFTSTKLLWLDKFTELRYNYRSTFGD